MAKNFPNTIQRKIFKYEVYCDKRDEKESIVFPYMEKLLEKLIKNYNLINFNNELDSRWYAIEEVKQNGFQYEVVLINCKYNYRPNLINIENRVERTSPKTDVEGDKEKTHILFYGNTLLFESRRNGTSISIFSRFLNTAWSNIRKTVDPSIDRIVIKQVLDSNFLDMIKSANRVKNIKIVAHSNLIGSEYFNFNDDSGVDDCYTLEIKAKKRNKFDKENLIRKFESLFAEDIKFEKVLVELNDEEGNPRIINTDQFAQQFIVYVEKDANGEINSTKLFEKLKEII